MTAAKKYTFDRQTDFLLGAWGNALRNGWEPRLGVPQNVLARYIPQKGKPIPEVDEETLDRVHIAFARLERDYKNWSIAIYAHYVASGPLKQKLNALRLGGIDWTKRSYDDYLSRGRVFMRGALGA